jgi:uncharacterized membrane-anchored protein YitT (DUF2179 family)
MNIKIKAATQVALAIIGVVIVAVGVKMVLQATTIATVVTFFNGVAFGALCVVIYMVISLLYNIRLSQLEYRQKLQKLQQQVAKN